MFLPQSVTSLLIAGLSSNSKCMIHQLTLSFSTVIQRLLPPLNSRFKSIVEPLLQSHPRIPHHLIFFLQNYFESISLIATNPSALQQVSTEEGAHKYKLKFFSKQSIVSEHTLITLFLHSQQFPLLISVPTINLYSILPPRTTSISYQSISF